MTAINFVFYAYPKRDDGTYPIHLHVKQLDPLWNETPHAERKSIKDAAQIVQDIVRNNTTDKRDEGDTLLCDGEPPDGAFPVFRFTLGVSWDRKLKLAHYTRIDYQRLEWDAKWLPVASVGMELYNYTFSVIRKREKAEIKEKTRAA